MILRRTMLLATAAIAAIRPAGATPPEHRVTVTDATGHAQTDAPLRLGRPFARGAWPDGVAVLVDGKPGAGQADIKQRWPDGSVKHAILSAAIPKLAAHGTATLTFAAAPRPERAAPDAQALLAAAKDFDAVLQITEDGTAYTASARKMIEDGHFTVWAHGPVATTLLCVDHGTAKTYDMGGGSKPLRPGFHVTFWHASRRVHVRVTAEVAQANALRDMRYDAAIVINGRREFAQAAVPHQLATRWTKVFWADPAPGPAYNTDHAIPYVIAAKFLPQYDTSLHVPDRVAAEGWANFQKAPTAALYDAGVWAKYMPTTGGRDDIGPTTGPIARWLLSGDARLETIVRIQADLAGAWGKWVRETDPHKSYDASGATPALGRPISVYARPSLWLDGRNKSTPADRVEIQPPALYPTDAGWVADDGAHQPDPFSVPYMLLGDPDLLAQMQMWASTDVSATDPEYRSERAPDGRMLPSGAIIGQTRGQAWQFRTRMLAAFLSPDGTPEQAYLSSLVDDAIAYWEGRCEVTSTRYQASRIWKMGQARKLGAILPLFDEPRETIRSNEGVASDRLGGGTCFWQTWMALFVMGWARDVGFPTGPLLAHCGQMLTGQFKDPAHYDPLNVGRYYTGTRTLAGVPLPDWPSTIAYYNFPQPDPVNNDISDGYLTYACGAATMLIDQPGGPEAYAWLRARAYDPNRAAFALNPKWAFVPRAG